MANKKASKKTSVKYVYSVVLWDSTGNKLLDKKTVKVSRATQKSAKEFMSKKYPKPYFFELDSIEK
jgi:hypothetical protein